jgi:hypothetical protein
MQAGPRAARQAALPAQARPAVSGRAGPACYAFVLGRARAGPRAARSARPIWPSITPGPPCALRSFLRWISPQVLELTPHTIKTNTRLPEKKQRQDDVLNLLVCLLPQLENRTHALTSSSTLKLAYC